MLKTLSVGISYHGWRIKVVPDQYEYFFCCYHPDLPDFCNDGLAYPTLRDAWFAACQFVDREIAVHAILPVLGEWLATQKINEEEYWNLSNFE